MKEVHYWIADDGESFSNKGECREHEYKCRLKELNGSLVVLDINGNPKDGLFQNLESLIESAMFVRLDNENAVEFWNELNDYFGCCHEGCCRPGLYYYSDNDDSWLNFDDEIEKLKKQKAILINGGA